MNEQQQKILKNIEDLNKSFYELVQKDQENVINITNKSGKSIATLRKTNNECLGFLKKQKYNDLNFKNIQLVYNFIKQPFFYKSDEKEAYSIIFDIVSLRNNLIKGTKKDDFLDGDLFSQACESEGFNHSVISKIFEHVFYNAFLSAKATRLRYNKLYPEVFFRDVESGRSCIKVPEINLQETIYKAAKLLAKWLGLKLKGNNCFEVFNNKDNKRIGEIKIKLDSDIPMGNHCFCNGDYVEIYIEQMDHNKFIPLKMALHELGHAFNYLLNGDLKDEFPATFCEMMVFSTKFMKSLFGVKNYINVIKFYNFEFEYLEIYEQLIIAKYDLQIHNSNSIKEIEEITDDCSKSLISKFFSWSRLLTLWVFPIQYACKMWVYPIFKVIIKKYIEENGDKPGFHLRDLFSNKEIINVYAKTIK